MRLLVTLSLLAAFLLSPRLVAGVSSPLTVTISPNGFVQEGTDLKVSVRVKREKGDRSIQIALDCDHYYGDSAFDITSEDGSVFTAKFVDIPDGDCVGIARLLREEGGEIRPYQSQSQVVKVLPVGPESWQGV